MLGNFPAMSAARFILVFLAAAGSALASSSVSFTNSSTALGNNSYVNLALGKFDTGLGTLTGVVVTVNFTTIEGSFTVSTPGDSATPADISFADARITIRQAATNTLGFTQLGQTAFAMTTTPGMPFVVPAPNGSETLGVNTTNVFVGNFQNISSGFWSAYQSVGGVGSVVFQVRNSPDIAVSGGIYSLNALAFTATADMTVTYSYTAGPTPVPEPGTWATAGLLVAAAGYIRWRRSRSAKQDEAPAAA